MEALRDAGARDTGLQAVLDACRPLMTAAPETPALAAFLDKVFAGLARTGTASEAHRPHQTPLHTHMPRALAITAASAGMERLARAFAALAPRLDWQPRTGAERVGEPFASGHANAVLVGENGMEEHDQVRVGVSLVAPHIAYIEHRHPPEEAYLVLSAGEWQQDRGPWFARAAGQMVHNPGGILHAMRAGPEPLLAIWMLWEGD